MTRREACIRTLWWWAGIFVMTLFLIMFNANLLLCALSGAVYGLVTRLNGYYFLPALNSRHQKEN